jgi:hypothetical protein
MTYQRGFEESRDVLQMDVRLESPEKVNNQQVTVMNMSAAFYK